MTALSGFAAGLSSPNSGPALAGLRGFAAGLAPDQPDLDSGPAAGRAPRSWVGARTFTASPGRGTTETPPPWQVHRAQHGPVNAPMGYQRAATTDSAVPAGVPEQPVDHVAANADTGFEPASQESVDSLHAKIDSLASSASSGVASSGPAQDSAVSSGYVRSGTAGTPFSTPISGPQQQAAKHQAALESMLAGHQHLAAIRARFSQNASNRTQASAASGIRPPSTTNAMSQQHADRSFNGQFGSGNSQAESTWNTSKWSSR